MKLPGFQFRKVLFRPALKRALRRYGRRKATENFILSYSPGQAGSSSIDHSLSEYEGGRLINRIHHLHYLNPATIAHEQPYTRWFYAQNGRIHGQYLHSLYVRQMLDAGADLAKVKLITSYRDPLRSCIAGFFQGLYRTPGFDMTRFDSDNSDEFINELSDTFLQRGDIDHYLNWFDRQVMDVFGIDVYAYAFPHEQGYQLLDSQPGLLVIRTEQLDNVGSESISRFLGLKDFKLERANEAADKTYHRHYEAFRKRIRLPAAWLDKVEVSRFFRHFFPVDEQAKILSEWRSRL